jgi:hypothetical protein
VLSGKNIGSVQQISVHPNIPAGNGVLRSSCAFYGPSIPCGTAPPTDVCMHSIRPFLYASLG